MNAAVPLALALAAVTGVLAVHHQTVGATAALWARSPTFAHGFLVGPAAAWLVWRRRRPLLAAATPQPAAPGWQLLAGLLLLLALGLVWLLASLAQAPAMMSLALVLMVAAAVLATLGAPATRCLAFPLAYLLLAVPFGEALIPPLIDFTASFTVAALHLSGIPVFRDQQYLVLPSGNWSVEQACSGLRYLIASAALGTLYGYLIYRSLWRRLLFAAVALVLPLLANGVRAYGIVLLGHVSDMQLATGVDHLVYGWLFFGLVCLLLFWCGGLWAEPAPAPAPATAAAPLAAPVSLVRAAVAAVACVAIAAAAPAMSARLSRPVPSEGAALAALRQLGAGASGAVRLHVLAPAWQPAAAGIPPDAPYAAWRALSDGPRQLSLDGRTLAVRQQLLRRDSQRVLLWRWYRQGQIDTVSPWRARLLLAQSRLTRVPDTGAELLVSTPYDERGQGAAAAETRLLAYTSALLPLLDLTLAPHHVAAR